MFGTEKTISSLLNKVCVLENIVATLTKTLGYYIVDGELSYYPKFHSFIIENNDEELNKPAIKKEVEELKNILKEAGIIVTPPKNISIPDPRGYSVNKIK
jgi:hypothetical protein